jgi:hypothetical protein
MSPKDKHVLARDHLDLAREEADDERLGSAATMLLHAVEAAIDALAADNGIATNPTHWRRADIAKELHAKGILPADESGLIRMLNEERKRFAYEGDEPTFGGDGFESVFEQVEAVVVAAEAGA